MSDMSEMTESATAEVPTLTLGWRLQMAMAHGGQTRYSMAEALGVGISTITRWTSDKGTPKKAYITQWAWLTRVPVDWLETGISTPATDPGAHMTTSGYIGDPLPFPVSAVNPDTRSSHNLAWQVVAGLTGQQGSAQPRGTASRLNDQGRVRSRSLAQPVSAVEEIVAASRVAA